MDAIVKRIWWIAIPTALAVLAFQLYWLRTTYVAQHNSFIQVASDALQKAYDQAIVTSAQQFGKRRSKDSIPMVRNFVNVLKVSGNLKNVPDSLRASVLMKKKYKAVIQLPTDSFLPKFADAQVKWPDIKVEKNIDLTATGIDVDRFLASVFAFTNFIPIDSAQLDYNYRQQLYNRQISLPFHLTIIRGDTSLPENRFVVAIRPSVPENPMVIAAGFDGLNSMLLLKILWPITLSFLLIVLITGCIWLLWRIIIRQKKLDVMKNDFIGNITHELKTPVAILSATNEALLAFGGMNDPEKTARYLRLGQDELRKLQTLVDNIMALTRMEHGDDLSGPEETISIHALLKATVSRFSNLPDVHIETEVQLTNEQLRTRPAALRTILSNLIDNAIKYTTAPEKQVQINVGEDNQYYFITVKDNGIGIDKAQLPFIFDKFYRVPHGYIHEVKGYGLGLSYVKNLVQQLGGQISVQSHPEEGSTFTIQFKRS